jgi:endoglucanase
MTQRHDRPADRLAPGRPAPGRPAPIRSRSSHRRSALGIGALGIALALIVAGCTSTTPQPTPTRTTLQTESSHELFKGGLYVQPGNLAAQAAQKLQKSGDAAAVNAAQEIATTPVAIWLGDQYNVKQVGQVIRDNLAAAKKKGTTPVFVTYAIPHRDCGDYSAGGFSAGEYPAWTKAVAAALKGHRAAVIVEPDSLAMLSNCPAESATRIPLIKKSVEELAAAGVPAYLDAGNSHWVAPATMASRLKAAGIASARGFFTNVASFYRVDQERSYAEKVSALTGDSHYVIDVSRNGQGWKGTWCNPSGTGLGQDPHVAGGTSGLDALLWIKSPGISDGTCNGGPKAGAWFASYAVALVKHRKQ